MRGSAPATRIACTAANISPTNEVTRASASRATRLYLWMPAVIHWVIGTTSSIGAITANVTLGSMRHMMISASTVKRLWPKVSGQPSMKLSVSLTSSRKRLSTSPAVPRDLRGPRANISQPSMSVRTMTRDSVVKDWNTQTAK